jgi:hypothetical protein
VSVLLRQAEGFKGLLDDPVPGVDESLRLSGVLLPPGEPVDEVAEHLVPPFVARLDPGFLGSRIKLTISTFSCDIAYSDGPAASRASARSANHSARSAFPLR